MTPFELHVPDSAVGGVVTIGNFDGVHRGHQAMLAVVADLAAQRSIRAIVVTFDPHPVNVLKPNINLPRLTSIATRTKLLTQHGADDVIILPVCQQMLDMPPEQFFNEIVIQKLDAAGLVEGPDFHFGKDRMGNTAVLKSLCQKADLSLTVISPVCSSNQIISSTTIRQLISNGDVSGANELLGHSYSLKGKVAPGVRRGRTLGFATANMEDIEVLLPADGVYAGSSTINGDRYAAALNIGPNPTFGEQARKVECHLIGFSGDLYGELITIELLSRIRGLRTFDSPDHLVAQIASDVEECREAFDSTNKY